MPLISVTHLAFSSADPVSELSEADLEKVCTSVDIICHTGSKFNEFVVFRLWIRLVGQQEEA